MTDDILFEEHTAVTGKLGVVVLNRPKAMNALTEEMCILLDEKLQVWAQDDGIKAVLIRGEGERAFCAGGDVRKVWEVGRDNLDAAASFFEHEYQMNNRIFHFPKPFIALMHGITMGGGLGVSVHGSYKVAMDNLKLAMPETGIGFFPDVGGTYFLPRCPNYFGFYLGLTGQIIDAAAAKTAGLVNSVIDPTDADMVINKICQTDLSQASIENSIKQLTKSARENLLTENKAEIIQHFNQATIPEVFQSLENSKTEFANTTLATLKTKSPTSLQITLNALQHGAKNTFDDCQRVELNLAKQFLRIPDFYEGVRAALIDKDRQPNWQPAPEH